MKKLILFVLFSIMVSGSAIAADWHPQSDVPQVGTFAVIRARQLDILEQAHWIAVPGLLIGGHGWLTCEGLLVTGSQIEVEWRPIPQSQELPCQSEGKPTS